MPAEVIQILRRIGASVKPVSTYNPSTGNEEILYRHARPVLGVHLLLRQNPWVPTLRVGNATILSSLSAFRAPDDPDPRNSRPYRANTGAGSIHPSADSARGATGLSLASARPQRTICRTCTLFFLLTLTLVPRRHIRRQPTWFCRTGTVVGMKTCNRPSGGASVPRKHLPYESIQVMNAEETDVGCERSTLYSMRDAHMCRHSPCSAEWQSWHSVMRFSSVS
jgi:hypothetical protein